LTSLREAIDTTSWELQHAVESITKRLDQVNPASLEDMETLLDACHCIRQSAGEKGLAELDGLLSSPFVFGKLGDWRALESFLKTRSPSYRLALGILGRPLPLSTSPEWLTVDPEVERLAGIMSDLERAIGAHEGSDLEFDFMTIAGFLAHGGVAEPFERLVESCERILRDGGEQARAALAALMEFPGCAEKLGEVYTVASAFIAKGPSRSL
jgi:hypothetical protein